MAEGGREQGGGGRGTPGHHALLPHHQSQDLISSFLSTVPAGFPLSPGPYLADIAGLAPLSPGLGPAPNYHAFALSPRHQDPPSPSRYLHQERPHHRPALALHSPRVLSPPRALLDSPHRAPSACNSPRRYLASPLRVSSRTHSPDLHRAPELGHAPASPLLHRAPTSPLHRAPPSPLLHRAPASPINLHNFHRDSFDSPARPEAWPSPPYDQEAPPAYPPYYLPHPAPRRPYTPSPPRHLMDRSPSHLSPRRPLAPPRARHPGRAARPGDGALPAPPRPPGLASRRAPAPRQAADRAGDQAAGGGQQEQQAPAEVCEVEAEEDEGRGEGG